MAQETSQPFRELDVHIRSLLGPDVRTSLRVSVLPALISGIARISGALRSSQIISNVGTANAFGDEQLNVDVLAERIVREELAKCPTVLTASSEEDPVERDVHDANDLEAQGSTETYTLAFDPLDGSSIIASNWTVGTIMGIWDGQSALHQAPSTAQVAAVLGVYGPRTNVVIALRVPNAKPVCFEVGLGDKDGVITCEILRTSVELTGTPFKTRYFAPANLRAAAENKEYRKLIEYYIEQKYTLRYIAGLVPDVYHILAKGHGVYVSPVTATSKAKLRRLYELAPIALVMECAGASAVDPSTGHRILDHAIDDCDERGGLLCGTPEEVEHVKRVFGLQ